MFAADKICEFLAPVKAEKREAKSIAVIAAPIPHDPSWDKKLLQTTRTHMWLIKVRTTASSVMITS